MASFIVYSTLTGEILRHGKCQDGIEAAQAQAGEVGVVEETGATGETHYVLLGPPVVLVAKDAMGASIDTTYVPADGVAVATISDIPLGAALYVDGIFRATISDGSVEFSSDVFGVHRLRLEHYRYLATEFTVGVGLYVLPVATEVDRGISCAARLSTATEVEAALSAHQERTARLSVVTEVEVGVAAKLTLEARLDPAAEVELGIAAAAPLPPATEVNAGVDAVLSREAQLDVATEFEDALDAA